MSKSRKRAVAVEGLEDRFCLSNIGFDHIVAPKPAGSLGPTTTSLDGTLAGVQQGTSNLPHGGTTSRFVFVGSLADPGPVNATLAVSINRLTHLTQATVALKNSLGSIHLVSRGSDYLGVRQTANSSAFGAIYHIQSGSGSYAHLHGTGTFVLTATPATATSAVYQLQFTPTNTNGPSIKAY